jgi:hypothetical protein
MYPADERSAVRFYGAECLDLFLRALRPYEDQGMLFQLSALGEGCYEITATADWGEALRSTLAAVNREATSPVERLINRVRTLLLEPPTQFTRLEYTDLPNLDAGGVVVSICATFQPVAGSEYNT